MDLPFLFPIKSNGTMPANDIYISLAMMKYWSNFAKTGYVLFCIDKMKRWFYNHFLIIMKDHYKLLIMLYFPQLTRRITIEFL